MITFLQASAQAAQGSQWSFWIMMIVLFAIMYFFMIRPQSKKQKELQKFRNALKVGDEVVTIGGIYGTIRSIDTEKHTAKINVATGVDVVFSIEAINPIGGEKK